MSFSANKTVRDAIITALENDYAAELAAVAAEFGISGAIPLRKVFRTTDTADQVTPCAVVGGVEADVDDTGAIVSDVSATIMLCLMGGDPDQVDLQMEAHLAATVRLFARRVRSGYEFHVRRFASDEPVPWSDAELLQTAAVQVTAKVAQAP